MKKNIDEKPVDRTYCERHKKKKTKVSPGGALNCEDCWKDVRNTFVMRTGKTLK